MITLIREMIDGIIGLELTEIVRVFFQSFIVSRHIWGHIICDAKEHAQMVTRDKSREMIE